MAVADVFCKTSAWKCNWCGGIGSRWNFIDHASTCARGEGSSESVVGRRSETAPVVGYYAIEVDGRHDDRHEHW